MTPEQLEHRNALMDRLDGIDAREAAGRSDALRRERAEVIRELLVLAQEADSTQADRLERGRTWRFIGMNYYDLGAGIEVESLELARDAYNRAETLLLGLDDAEEHAKLDLFFGSALRGLARGTDRRLLEEAMLRYRRAREVLRDGPPQRLAYLEQQLSLAELQLALIEGMARATEGLAGLQRIDAVRTRNGAGATPESDREAVEMLRQLAVSSEGPSAIVKDVSRAVDRSAMSGTSLPENLPRALTGLSAVAQSRYSSPETVMLLEGLAKLRERYASEVAKGHVKPARQHNIVSILNELDEMAAEQPDEVQEMLLWLDHGRELMSRAFSTLEEASYGVAITQGSRVQGLLRFLEAQATFLMREINRPNLPTGESRAAQDLFDRLSKISANLAATGNDESAKEVERETLRQTSLDVRRFARRRHLTLAAPFWGKTPHAANPNAVFFSGSCPHRDMVEQQCRERGLDLLDRRAGRQVGRGRWEDLARSAVGVFDLTVEPGPELAAVCYDLGLAQALGITPIVLSGPQRKVPFDVNVHEYRLDGEYDEDLVGRALDEALYSAPEAETGSSVTVTLQEAGRRFSAGSPFDHALAQQTLASLSHTVDSIVARRRLEYLVACATTDLTSLLLPAWPGAYPAPLATRCFHVMPFCEAWSDLAMQVAEEACNEANVVYVRGDFVADPEIIGSIWKEIAVATHVLVDITTFSANVALELGLAHALGRKVLLVGQGTDVEARLWPSIRKLRVHGYVVRPDASGLRRATQRFLAR
jgi:hypothetical protein